MFLISQPIDTWNIFSRNFVFNFWKCELFFARIKKKQCLD